MSAAVSDFHDYDAIYDRPGLYEQLFYERLRCSSPEVVTTRLARALKHEGETLETHRVLDLGAGNGIVADSDPTTELAETRIKFQAVLSALVRP